MTNLNVDVLITIEDSITDSDLQFNGSFTPEIIAGTIQQNFPGISIHYSIPESYSGKLIKHEKSITRKGSEDISFWKNFFKSTSAKNAAVIKGDSPFFDPDILKEMTEVHVKYLAEFTFSENLPEGFSCEIISGSLLDQVPDMGEETLPLVKVIKGNINRFDVELFYKEPDIRNRRLSFRSSLPRERRVMENMVGKNGAIPRYSEMKDLIESSPDILFAGPSYVELELTGKCRLDCIFCYRKSLKDGEHKHLDTAIFNSIIEGMRDFELPYTLCLSGSGEPMEHPAFYSILETAVKEKLIEQLIIETNGIEADANFKNFLMSPENKKIKVIINNNGIDRDSYQKFHNSDYFDAVKKNILSLSELNSGDNRIYIQVMKINETDEFSGEREVKSYLDRFYDFWEGEKIPIILQKQNVYFGKIQDRRYSDLSPVRRTPCWHLQRDIYILSDGNVSFCKQDIDGERSYGSIANSGLKDIWEIQKKAFLEDYAGKFPAEPDCKNCDEWYTFNF